MCLYKPEISIEKPIQVCYIGVYIVVLILMLYSS